MELREKIQRVWKNRAQIGQGLFNMYLSMREDVKQEAARRLEICQSNKCGYWDPTGQSDKLVYKGEPGCMGCGCRGTIKANCMECNCYLKDIGETPLWEAIMDSEQEKEYRQKEYEEQFKK